MDNLAQSLVLSLNSLFSADMLLVLTFVVSIFFLVVFSRLFGLVGLMLYNILAILMANIQVMRFTEVSFWNKPMALGTVLFTTTFLVHDIIVDRYGVKSAQKSVWLGFATQLMWVCFSIVTIAHPLPDTAGHSLEQTRHWQSIDEAMRVLLLPSGRIVFSSLIAYVISEFSDIALFNTMRVRSRLPLWCRQIISMGFGGLIDSIVFSWLAWIALSPEPVSWDVFWWGYVISAQVVRIAVTLCSTPCIYLVRRILKPQPLS